MVRLASIVSFVILVILQSCQTADKKTIIGYVQITQDPVLDAAKAGLFRALKDSGFIDGQNIKILDNNAQGDISMITTILQSLQSQNADLIITNSTPCMSAAAQIVKDIPVVFTVAFGPEQIGFKSIPDNLYGVYDPWKADEFVDLIQACLPGLKRVGIPYNNAEPNAEYSVKILSAEFAKRGITLVTAAVGGANDIMQAGQSLAAQQIDAMVVAADNTVYLGLGVLAKISASEKIPLFVSDPLQAEKGAALGFGVDYDSWGYQSGLKAIDLLKGRNISMHKIEPILKYQLILNEKACHEQGLSVPEEIRKNANRIIK